MSKFLDLAGLTHFLSKIKTWTNEQLNKYLPLTVGSGNPLTGTLYSRDIRPSSTNSNNVGTSSAYYANGYFTNLVGSGGNKYLKEGDGYVHFNDLFTDGTAKRRVSIGLNTTANYDGAIAIGPGATAGTCIAIGNKANSKGSGAIAIGDNVATTGNPSVAIGNNSTISSPWVIGIGSDVNIGESSTYSIAIGRSANVNSSVSSGIAIGKSASAGGNNAIAIGTNAYGIINNVIIGNNANSEGAGNTAIGYGATVSSTYAIALGYNSQLLATDIDSSDASSYRPLSLGRTGTSTAKRRIINVKDGINNNDVATVGQLKDAANYIDLSGYTKNTEIWPDTNKQKVLISDGNTNNIGTYGVAIGYGVTNGNYSVTVGGAAASGTYGVAVGRSANAANYSTALGYGAAANLTYGGAIGYNSQLLESDLDSSDNANYRPISLGRTNPSTAKRRIINVKDGIKDNDVATVGQLNKIDTGNLKIISGTRLGYSLANYNNMKSGTYNFGLVDSDIAKLKKGDIVMLSVYITNYNNTRAKFILEVKTVTPPNGSTLGSINALVWDWIDPVL